jgi:hypothetical protein
MCSDAAFTAALTLHRKIQSAVALPANKLVANKPLINTPPADVPKRPAHYMNSLPNSPSLLSTTLSILLYSSRPP